MNTISVKMETIDFININLFENSKKAIIFLWMMIISTIQLSDGFINKQFEEKVSARKNLLD